MAESLAMNTCNTFFSVNALSKRCFYQVTFNYQKQGNRIHLPPSTPENITRDWVGPADPASNIRRFKFHIPEDETPLQKQYRLQREDVQDWNHAFWAKHNRKFQQEKNKFIEESLDKLKSRGVKQDKLSADELAVFYKKFLNENYQAHKDYNREWYKKNFGLAWLAFKVNFEKLFRTKKKR